MNTPAEKISTDQAKQDKLFYFVATVVPYRLSDKKVLLLKRSEREIAHPGRWGIPGGKLEHKDIDVENPDVLNGNVKDYLYTIEELVKRETREEAGIGILTEELKFVSSKTFIRPDNVPAVLFQFTAPVDESDMGVVLEEGGFTDYAWVGAGEFENYDCIDGIPEESLKAIKLYD